MAAGVDGARAKQLTRVRAPLLVLVMVLSNGGPARAAGDVTAFCQSHPTMDDPGPVYFGPAYRPGQVPDQVEATEASDWRCMDGAVLLCANSADGSTCGRLDRSQAPSRLLREVCRDSPGLDLVPVYAAGRSTSVWRCRGRKPVIVHTVLLDRRGYMVGAWVRLVVRRGNVVAPRDGALGADPRWAWWPR